MMLYDEDHPMISLALLMLREAFTRGVTRIELHRRESSISVVYLSGESAEEQRDVMKNRQWHGLLAALHMLAGETAFSYAMEGADREADGLINRIEIDRKTPRFDNGQLRDLRAQLKGRLVVEMSFSDARVQLSLRECDPAEPFSSTTALKDNKPPAMD